MSYVEMIYSHVPRFQLVMQKALAIRYGQQVDDHDLKLVGHTPAGRVPKYNPRTLDALLQLGGDLNTLNRFRRASFPAYASEEIENTSLFEVTNSIRVRSLAEKIWNFLVEKGDIEAVFANKGLKFDRHLLYPVKEVAGAVIGMFNATPDRANKFTQNGLAPLDGSSAREWFCYKLSSSRERSIVKSTMSFVFDTKGYFFVDDEQTSSGKFEITKKSYSEFSHGFAFGKTGNLWVMLAQHGMLGQQSEYAPRIMCFDTTLISQEHENSMIALLGYIIEQDNRYNRGSVQKSPIALTSIEYEQEMFEFVREGRKYSAGEQCDVYPIDYLCSSKSVEENVVFPDIVRDHLIQT